MFANSAGFINTPAAPPERKREDMEVLLIGTGRLAEALIDRLNKNGERVYLLTGRREHLPMRQHVFEQYDFTYDDDSVKDIFDSIKPDITIFTGAWDNLYRRQANRRRTHPKGEREQFPRTRHNSAPPRRGHPIPGLARQEH